MAWMFRKLFAATAMAGLILTPLSTEACTSFVLRNPDGSFVYGRTVEFGVALPIKLALYPRNHQYKGAGPDGVVGSGLTWTGKYAVIGQDALGMEVIADGMNEKGLTGGMLYLPVSSVYQDPKGDDARNSIASYQVVNWALSNFATVDEIRAGLQSIFVNNSAMEAWKGVVRMHFTFHDTTGKSIVVEYIDGKLDISDNPVGTLTNEPPFKWQMMNVENYLNLSPFDKESTDIGGATFAPRSAGSGLHGLPGDFMSQSRFLRAMEFSKAADAYVPNMNKVDVAWHLVNMFDIPPGSSIVSREKNKDGNYVWDFTQTSAVADPKTLTYYVRPFGGRDITRVEFAGQDLDAAAVKFWDIENTTSYKALR